LLGFSTLAWKKLSYGVKMMKSVRLCQESFFHILFSVFVLTLFGILFIGNAYSLREAFGRGPIDESDYYPLEVGNKWEFERQYSIKGEKKTYRYDILIIKEVNKDADLKQYFNQKGKTFLMKSKEGILTEEGVYLLKHPFRKGTKWIVKKWEPDKRFFKIEETGITKKVRGKTYRSCIKVVARTMPLSIQRDGEGKEITFESVGYYAPNVGPVLRESYEIDSSGHRTQRSRMELISFKTNQSVAAFKPESILPQKLVTQKESFRFPKMGFEHPRLCSNGIWVVYQKEKYTWKKLYYSRIGKKQEQKVPFCRPEHKKILRTVSSGDWSPTGEVFAVDYETEDGKWIGLVDFSGEKPAFMESFKGESPINWISDTLIVYKGVRGDIMQKELGAPAEPVIIFKESQQKECRARSIQAAFDGTVLFTCWHGSIFATHLSNSSQISPLYIKPRKKEARNNLKTLSFCDLSPDGKHVIMYREESRKKFRRLLTYRSGVLFDLEKKEEITSFNIMKRAKWSPNGTRFAYIEPITWHIVEGDASKTKSDTPHFFIYDLQTGETKDYGVGVSDNFKWTPDSEHILYSGKYFSPSHLTFKTGIFIMAVSDGKNVGQLTKIHTCWPLYMSKSYNYIVWSPCDIETFFISKNPFRESFN
jgi:hypothetical protein